MSYFTARGLVGNIFMHFSPNGTLTHVTLGRENNETIANRQKQNIKHIIFQHGVC